MMLQLVLLSLSQVASGGDSLSVFNEWLGGLDPVNERLKVVPSEWGNGLYPTEGVRKGEKVMVVPGRWVVSVENIKKWGEDMEVYRKVEEKEWVTAWLMVEKGKGDASRWWRWLNVLPQGFENVLYFEEDMVKAVEPSLIRTDVIAYRKQIYKGFEKLKKRYHEATYATYKWAKSVQSTRAWHLKGNEYLVPGAGMFNHALDDEDATFDYKKTKGRSMKFMKFHELRGDGAAVVYSDRSAGADEQLFESYGDNTNAIYFMYHGFVPEGGNPYECFVWVFERDLDKAKMAFLQRAKIPSQVCLHHREINEIFMLYHAVRSMPPSRSSCLDAEGDLQQLLTCGRHTTKTLKSCKTSLLRALSTSFSTTLEADLELLAPTEGYLEEDEDVEPVTGQMKAVVEYRVSQKKILQSVVDAVELKRGMIKKKKKKNKKKKGKGRVAEEL